VKIILWVEVECDDCGRRLRRLAVPGTPADLEAEVLLFASLCLMVVARDWRMEGYPSLWAGDLCSSCWTNEKRLLSIDNSTPIRRLRA
jgi:hypothetical protein